MKTILMIPGWHGSPPDHWMTRWSNTIPGAVMVEQKDWLNPLVDDWVAELERAVTQAGEPTFLVAHSLGCLAVAHWAKMSPSSGKIKGALLVSPPWFRDKADCPFEVETFAPFPMDRLPFPSILAVSDTDPYIPFENAQPLAEAWGSEFVHAGSSGHINVDSGHGPWPDGEQLLARLVPLTQSM